MFPSSCGQLRDSVLALLYSAPVSHPRAHIFEIKLPRSRIWFGFLFVFLVKWFLFLCSGKKLPYSSELFTRSFYHYLVSKGRNIRNFYIKLCCQSQWKTCTCSNVLSSDTSNIFHSSCIVVATSQTKDILWKYPPLIPSWKFLPVEEFLYLPSSILFQREAHLNTTGTWCLKCFWIKTLRVLEIQFNKKKVSLTQEPTEDSQPS